MLEPTWCDGWYSSALRAPIKNRSSRGSYLLEIGDHLAVWWRSRSLRCLNPSGATMHRHVGAPRCLSKKGRAWIPRPSPQCPMCPGIANSACERDRQPSGVAFCALYTSQNTSIGSGLAPAPWSPPVSYYSPPEAEEVSSSNIRRIWVSSARGKIGSRLLILSNTHKVNLSSFCQRPSTTCPVSAAGHIARATRYSALGHERETILSQPGIRVGLQKTCSSQ